jgi:hypothetical protein
MARREMARLDPMAWELVVLLVMDSAAATAEVRTIGRAPRPVGVVSMAARQGSEDFPRSLLRLGAVKDRCLRDAPVHDPARDRAREVSYDESTC